jgi:hypothetical protein
MNTNFLWQLLLGLVLLASANRATAEDAKPAKTRVPRVAAIVTVYHHNSHADVLVSRLLQTETLDGRGELPLLELASLYTDQAPASDISRRLAKEHGFRLSPTIADALTLGGDKLAVDGVLLIAEHGNYPESPTGQFQFPKRRFFTEIVRVFDASGRVVPVFCDKHLSDNWEDAKWIYDTAKQKKIPLMAGSSLPVLWRRPATDVRAGAKLAEVFAFSYHRLDAYGFHALEAVATLVERRAGGETGVVAVECREGDAVWKAEDEGAFSTKLMDDAYARLESKRLPAGKRIRDIERKPVLFTIYYADGLRASVLTANDVVGEWSVAWRYADGGMDSTLFWTQEARPFMHFAYQMRGIGEMMHTGKPTWPAERTLLTSGTLDALLISKKDGGRRIETPQLKFSYTCDRTWKSPPPPPPGRPIQGQ